MSSTSVPPIPLNDPEAARLHALREYGVLDTPAEPEFDALTRLAARLLDVPIALVSLVDAERQWFKSRVGLDACETPRDISFCDHAIRGNELMVVDDALADPRFADTPLVRGEPYIRFYAGAPLRSAQGWMLGTLCVIDRKPRQLRDDERHLLQELAGQVVAQLELRRQNRQLQAVLHHVDQDRLALQQAQQALAHSEARLREVLHETNDGWWEFDLDTHSAYFSPRAEKMLGYPSGALQRDAALQRRVLPADQRAAIRSALGAVLRGRQSGLQLTVELLHRHGERVPMLVRGHGQRNKQGRLQRLTGTLTDMRPIRRAERERQDLQAQRRADIALLDNLSSRVPGLLCQYRLWPDGRSAFPFASPGLREVYELEPETVRDDGSLIFERIHVDDRERVRSSILQSAQSLQPWRAEYRVQLPLRGLRWLQGEATPERLEDGSVLWHGFISDVSARKAAEQQLFQLAHFDPLTGLANRHGLMERLADFLSAARRHGQGGALLFIDLDNFKQINDVRGHAAGDRVLCWAAERLIGCVRREDLVARLGGDEFVIVLGDLAADPLQAATQAQGVATKICERLAESQRIEGMEWAGSASVGISLFPKPEQGTDDLLREADIAMYEAKSKGRNGWAIFEHAMHAAVEERLRLQTDLRRALDLQQFELHAQSQTGPEGELLGAELLLRWRHPERGLVPPNQFIPLAEETGLIVPLGDWVLAQATQALLALRAAGRGCLSLSVNVSPRQFHEAGFVERLEQLLRRSAVDPSRLVLEITEGLLLRRSDELLARMHRLSTQGLRFSIDDFGTGYSSLAYLQSMPLYEVKIDRGFVRELPDARGGTAIVQSILSMSRHLGLHVVAEGVETAEQAAFLLAHGCDALQGFWLHRPLPLADWLAAQGLVPTPS